MNEELKTCPFCGGEAYIFPYDGGYSAHCVDMSCPSNGAYFTTEAEAVAAWNARVERTCHNIAEPDEMSDRPFTCSECGARGPYGEGTYHIGGCEKNENGSVAFWDAWPVYKYCPNCGAKVCE